MTMWKNLLKRKHHIIDLYLQTLLDGIADYMSIKYSVGLTFMGLTFRFLRASLEDRLHGRLIGELVCKLILVYLRERTTTTTSELESENLYSHPTGSGRHLRTMLFSSCSHHQQTCTGLLIIIASCRVFQAILIRRLNAGELSSQRQDSV